MAQSPIWLNIHQIERRQDVLQTVQNLLRASLNSGSTVEEKLAYAVTWVALNSVREANALLRSAQDYADKNGAAPVPKEVLEVVKTFNSIGPVRLKGIKRLSLGNRAKITLLPKSDQDT